jgi:hypothetical protein
MSNWRCGMRMWTAWLNLSRRDASRDANGWCRKCPAQYSSSVSQSWSKSLARLPALTDSFNNAISPPSVWSPE